jgi:hypothetical protein
MTGAPLTDEIQLAIRAGAVRAVRTSASTQRQKATDGTSSAGAISPSVIIRLADEAEAEGAPR